MKIFPPTKVYVAKSPIHGLGVFASELIKDGEIIETTPLYDMKIPMDKPSEIMENYRFNWPQGKTPITLVLPWGYGCIYNHSKNNNAQWRSNFETFTFEFYAIRDIQKDEEICTYYGDVEYFESKDYIVV